MSNESNLTWRVNGQDERGFHSNEHHQPNSTDVEMFPLNSTLESNSRATKEERQQASPRTSFFSRLLPCQRKIANGGKMQRATGIKGNLRLASLSENWKRENARRNRATIEDVGIKNGNPLQSVGNT
ncbi:uncharacterized protein LOC122637897 isoform X2 [Vespula pensylvanica]|uniref:uncharacterized protein LOC122637897 isoform X2 n=1 Tax=Vespula pensylvanica TaxID=30213 RepID=UPI001CBA2A76|nr:uncharacterized protein LOC122637897 isoform X2 [Vespula pensylvanica]